MKWSVAAVFILLCLTFQSSYLLAQSPCSDPIGKISVTPSSLNFGNVQVGDDSSVLTFQIINNDKNLGMLVTQITSQNSRFAIVSAPNIPFCIDPSSSQNNRSSILSAASRIERFKNSNCKHWGNRFCRNYWNRRR